MSFGGGFGGFGQNNNNNNNQSSGFGGFGANNSNTTSGFGGGTTGGGFGQSSNTGGGMFGGNTNSTGSGFGASTGSNLFGGGSNTATNNTSSFGGFGGTNNATNSTSSPFGGGAASGGLFGSSNANKTTGFGSTGNTGGSLFGGGNTNTASTGFGGGGFGASNNPGLGQTGGDPPGTGGTPFQAFTEKEANSASQTNSFQNILLQEPYRKWSSEELRLADYMQGRRHGNGTTSGGGAFGVSSGFGGGGFGASNNTNTTGGGLFGSNNNTNNTQQQSGGGLFGANNNNTTSGFGQSNTGGFGSTTANNNTSGGLFGSKPAGGGMFGGNTQTQQSTGFGGGNTGGFGSTNNQSTGFGSSNTAATGGGLFGSNNNANNQAKPGGLFGSSTTNTNTAGGFGSTGNNAFGSTNTNTNTGGGLFGGNNNNQQQQQQQSGGGLFGNANNNNNQQQQAAGGGFGGFGQNNQNQSQQSGGGLFGNNQQKPAAGGLFGSGTTTNTNTGGGLFGGQNNNNQQQQQTGAFGQNNNQQQQGGGLFGNKPATGGGGGLFGSSTTQQNNNAGGGGLFGNANNNQNQQSTGTGLFGNSMNNNNQQQQKPGGLFGNSTQNAGGGLFGGQNNQAQGGGLFGNSTNNQQQNQGMGNSLLGNSQQSSNAPQGLTANLNDVSAYGSPSLFASGSNDQSASLGPLATPVGGSAKPKRASILPMYKLAPSSASRFATPQKRGFGFSYSTYGTPGSASSSIASTPGTAGRSLLGSSSSGALNKSMSTNNLRRNFNTEDSILAPGAFSASSGGPRWYGSTGSKKLVISRDMRSDLFSTPQKDKQAQDGDSSRKIAKKVSFTADTDDAANTEEQPEIRGALPAPDGSPSTNADVTPRQNRITNGSNGSQTPEADRRNGDIQDESNMPTPGRSSGGFADSAPGEYWCKPSMAELEQMNRVQRKSVSGLIVGRENVGSVEFLSPADISAFNPEQLFGDVVQLVPRSATVYPDAGQKPPVGHGINRPARITLEQSWPRGGPNVSARKIQKHLERLKDIKDTTFVEYSAETGVWVFEVQHFTTYGLDDSEDDEDDDTEMEAPVDSKLSQSQKLAFDASVASTTQDDTFQFRRSRGLPGAFDEPEEMIQDVVHRPESFLGVSSADSAPNDVRLSLDDDEEDLAEPMGEEYDLSDDEDMTRSDVEQHLAAEHEDVSSEDEEDFEVPKGTPGGILRARMRALKESAGPVNVEVADGDDWAEMLRKTVSPAKRDRKMLKELQEASPSRQNGQLIDLDKNEETDLRKSSVWRKSTTNKKDAFGATTAGIDKGRGFATSIDLMNSLFEKPKPASQNLRASTSATKGFPQWPYERQDKNLTTDEETKAFHDGSRPTWGPNETLVVTRPLGSHRRSLRENDDLLGFTKSNIQSSRQAVRLGKFSTEPSEKYLRTQETLTDIIMEGQVPRASLRANSIKDLFHNQNMNDPASIHENRVWELASILFDGNSQSAEATRKASLSMFWAELVDQASTRAIGLAGTSEEKALACLAGHRIAEACKYLLEGKNFHLATLVPLIGTSETTKKDMREQIKSWHDSKMLSEFSEPIRAIYELLSGNPSVCEGMKGVLVEDRFESFVISKFFGLDWKQAFGLRLWYAISEQDDITAAIAQFQEDIDQDKESLPRPWYQDEKIQPLWFDYESHNRQDLLWGLLQLYALEDTDVEAILRPENSQLSPLDMRLSWQLGVALNNFTVLAKSERSNEKADATTVSYAAQLTGAGEWLEAVFVLLHLTDPSARQKAIQDHLCRHAALIGGESDVNFATLTEKFLIPAKWVWEALALYQRGVVKNAPYEVHCLVKAGAYEEAHRVLIQQVAPQAVIERDYATLESLMEQFDDHSSAIGDWTQGGELYNLFLSLLEYRAKGEIAPREILDRLLAGLQNEQVADGEIVRYAALSDMADETAKEIVRWTRKKQDVEFRSRILKLPLTQDRLLAYSVDLGMERYKEVMSH